MILHNVFIIRHIVLIAHNSSSFRLITFVVLICRVLKSYHFPGIAIPRVEVLRYIFMLCQSPQLMMSNPASSSSKLSISAKEDLFNGSFTADHFARGMTFTGHELLDTAAIVTAHNERDISLHADELDTFAKTASSIVSTSKLAMTHFEETVSVDSFFALLFGSRLQVSFESACGPLRNVFFITRKNPLSFTDSGSESIHSYTSSGASFLCIGLIVRLRFYSFLAGDS